MDCMLGLMGRRCKTIHIYVVTGNEIGPAQVREQCLLSEPLSSCPILPMKAELVATHPSINPAFSQNTNIQPPSNNDTPEHTASSSGIILSSDDDVFEQQLPIVSSSDDGEEFKDDEDEDDDALFEKYVDLGVETFDTVEEPVQLRVEMESYDSDEIGNLDGSDDDDGEHKRKSRYFNPVTDLKKNIQLKRGMIFADNKVFRKAVTQLSLDSGGDYYFLRNNKERISTYCKMKCDCPMINNRKKYICKSLKCGFKVLGRKYSDDGRFQLTEINPVHSCGWQATNSKLTTVWLADKYVEDYRIDPTWKLKTFIDRVKKETGFTISTYQAWKTRMRAMLLLAGNFKQEYARVRDYERAVIETNPGSSVFVKVELISPERAIFQRIYICLDACKKGFMRGCRPVIGVDGFHLRGAFTGQVLVAVGRDGNNQNFPIAFAVVEAERRETWGWFLENLMADVGECNPTFMSDRQKGLINELERVVPVDRTRVCVRHMYNNFKARWNAPGLKDAIWAAARACTVGDFKTALEDVKNHDINAFMYLMEQDVRTWSRHAFKEYTKCDMLVNNVCETFNAWILPARGLPVLSMCDWIRRQLMGSFVRKFDEMMKHEGRYTPKVIQKIEAAKTEGTRYCQMFWGSGNTYEVLHRGETYIVDMVQKTCSCFKWNLTGIPCPHAMHVIVTTRRELSEYISEYYTKEKYLLAYHEPINDVPGISQLKDSGDVQPEPPTYIIQPGRPKKNARRKEPGEEVPSGKRTRTFHGPMKCSQCGQPGHRKNKCTSGGLLMNSQAIPIKPSGRPTNSKTVGTGREKRKYIKKTNFGRSSQASVEAQGSVATIETHPTSQPTGVNVQVNMATSQPQSINQSTAMNVHPTSQSQPTTQPTFVNVQNNMAISQSQPINQSTSMNVQPRSQSEKPAPSIRVKYGQSQVCKSPRKVVAPKRWI